MNYNAEQALHVLVLTLTFLPLSAYVADVCPTLVAPANGDIVQGDNEFGDNAVYSCNVGFTLTGVRIRTCLNGGQWSGETPTCEGKAIDIH